jgi:hypothetical protein
MSRLATFFSVSLLLLGAAHDASAQSTCRAADGESARFLGVLTRMMQADEAGLRTSMSVSLVDTSQIVLVTNSTVCVQAGQALDSLAYAINPVTHSPASIPLFVFQIGTSYAIVDLLSPNANDAEFIHFFSSSWQYTGTSFVQ